MKRGDLVIFKPELSEVSTSPLRNKILLILNCYKFERNNRKCCKVLISNGNIMSLYISDLKKLA